MIFIGWSYALLIQARLWLTEHSLFNREKWTQDPLPASEQKRICNFLNFNLRYNLGGEERQYNVKVGGLKNNVTHYREKC